jgi:hypothetical protein
MVKRSKGVNLDHVEVLLAVVLEANREGHYTPQQARADAQHTRKCVAKHCHHNTPCPDHGTPAEDHGQWLYARIPTSPKERP